MNYENNVKCTIFGNKANTCDICRNQNRRLAIGASSQSTTNCKKIIKKVITYKNTHRNNSQIIHTQFDLIIIRPCGGCFSKYLQIMKSTLNQYGVYINCKEIEFDGKDCGVTIQIANCEDGYRAACNYHYNLGGASSPILQNDEPHPTEREAIASAIEKRLKSIINRSGVKENKKIVYLLHKLLQEYNQLDLFEDENN